MERFFLMTIMLSLSITGQSQNGGALHPGTFVNTYPSVASIPLPPGYSRSPAGAGTFGEWLKKLPLKKDRTVFLFDGSKKGNQTAQFAVLDISVGREDLQQCADAIMRLRAEYLYQSGKAGDICFCTNQGIWLNFREWAAGKRYSLADGRLRPYSTADGTCPGRPCFDRYLRTVFSYCGTLSLEKQLFPISSTAGMQIGDVLVKGGAPGHAMLVIDMATGPGGRKIYLLAQSYMPAQDIHVVINPQNPRLSPWYEADEALIITPEWTFSPSSVRTWTNF